MPPSCDRSRTKALYARPWSPLRAPLRAARYLDDGGQAAACPILPHPSLRKTRTDLADAQKEFDPFRFCYNYERPHAALALDVPAKHYEPSARAFVEDPTEPEYDSGKNLRKVTAAGTFLCTKNGTI